MFLNAENTNTKSKTLPSNIFHEFVGAYGTCLNFFTMAILPQVLVAGLSTTCSQKIHNQLVCNKLTTWYKVFANAKITCGTMV
jgi:p-aminobenzoyl-glutamate transporter AbgT